LHGAKFYRFALFDAGISAAAASAASGPEAAVRRIGRINSGAQRSPPSCAGLGNAEGVMKLMLVVVAVVVAVAL
jgi:hypothetical protein